MEEKKILDIALASSAIPFIFNPVPIDGALYADGGVNNPAYGVKNSDNTPLIPLLPLQLDAVLVVHLNPSATLQTPDGGPPLLHICPSEPLERLRGTGPLDFGKQITRDRIALGYRDAMVVLAQMAAGFLQGRGLDRVARSLLPGEQSFEL